jgi:hypothetical protein
MSGFGSLKVSREHILSKCCTLSSAACAAAATSSSGSPWIFKRCYRLFNLLFYDGSFRVVVTPLFFDKKSEVLKYFFGHAECYFYPLSNPAKPECRKTI